MKISIFGCATLSLVAAASWAQNDQEHRQQQISMELLKATQTYCEKVPTGANVESWKFSADGNAAAKGLTKLLVDVGGKLSIERAKQTTEGVLQSDLAAVLQKETDCKIEVFKLLMTKFAPVPEKRIYCSRQDFQPFEGMDRTEFRTAFGIQRARIESDLPDLHKDDHPVCLQARNIAKRVKEVDAQFWNSAGGNARSAYGEGLQSQIEKEQKELRLKVTEIEALRKKQESK